MWRGTLVALKAGHLRPATTCPVGRPPAGRMAALVLGALELSRPVVQDEPAARDDMLPSPEAGYTEIPAASDGRPDPPAAIRPATSSAPGSSEAPTTVARPVPGSSQPPTTAARPGHLSPASGPRMKGSRTAPPQTTTRFRQPTRFSRLRNEKRSR